MRRTVKSVLRRHEGPFSGMERILPGRWPIIASVRTTPGNRGGKYFQMPLIAAADLPCGREPGTDLLRGQPRTADQPIRRARLPYATHDSPPPCRGGDVCFRTSLEERATRLQLTGEAREALRIEASKLADSGVPCTVPPAKRKAVEQALHESFGQSCRAAMWVSGVLALLSALTAWLTEGGKPSRTQLT
jgi:hypothetical protein